MPQPTKRTTGKTKPRSHIPYPNNGNANSSGQYPKKTEYGSDIIPLIESTAKGDNLGSMPHEYLIKGVETIAERYERHINEWKSICIEVFTCAYIDAMKRGQQ